MAGIDVSQFVLNPLASSEAILSETEREMGVAVSTWRRHNRYSHLRQR
jgi:hypothetical protein